MNAVNKTQMTNEGGVNWIIYETNKPTINSVGQQHKRVDNNKTNKAQASRFCTHH